MREVEALLIRFTLGIIQNPELIIVLETIVLLKQKSLFHILRTWCTENVTRNAQIRVNFYRNVSIQIGLNLHVLVILPVHNDFMNSRRTCESHALICIALIYNVLSCSFFSFSSYFMCWKSKNTIHGRWVNASYSKTWKDRLYTKILSSVSWEYKKSCGEFS